MGDPVFERMATRHQSRTGGRASRADEEASQAGALVVEGVEVRSFDPRVPVFPNRAVALVIRHHENDVGLFGSGRKADEEDGEEMPLNN